MATKEKKKRRKCSDTLRFYLTAFFILLASFSSFAFLFLVPFVIDPGFSTLFAEFEQEPRICVTIDSISKHGTSNCSWSSCREGCTREIFKCTQILVNYKSDPEGFFRGKNYTDLEETAEMEWEHTGAKLFPNVKGCGYPPDVNCSVFNRKYSQNGTVFPCYYSKVDPEMTLTHLDIEEVKRSLMYAIFVPWGCFISSVLYLLITYVALRRPDPPPSDEPQETSSAKASKDASNYSLRSISKTINQGVNRFRRDPDDKGELEDKWKGSSDILLAPASLSKVILRRETLPPLERTPPVPRPASSSCALEVTKLLGNEDCKKSWP